jgi:hypothetical protein
VDFFNFNPIDPSLIVNMQTYKVGEPLESQGKALKFGMQKKGKAITVTGREGP